MDATKAAAPQLFALFFVGCAVTTFPPFFNQPSSFFFELENKSDFQLFHKCHIVFNPCQT